jgi:hypothetical protein
MALPIFRIPKKKYAGETTVVSLRLPKDLLREIDEIAQQTGRNRNEVLTMCLEFALEHMVRSDPSEKKAEDSPSGNGRQAGRRLASEQD